MLYHEQYLSVFPDISGTGRPGMSTHMIFKCLGINVNACINVNAWEISESKNYIPAPSFCKVTLINHSKKWLGGAKWG
jgi:hypothetical protein